MEDLHFADFIIADIIAGLKNCMFAEIAPRIFYPLYGIYIYIYIHTYTYAIFAANNGSLGPGKFSLVQII